MLDPLDYVQAVRSGPGSPLEGLPRGTAGVLPEMFAAHSAIAGDLTPEMYLGDLLLFVAAAGKARDWPARAAWLPHVSGRIDTHILSCARGDGPS